MHFTDFQSSEMCITLLQLIVALLINDVVGQHACAGVFLRLPKSIIVQIKSNSCSDIQYELCASWVISFTPNIATPYTQLRMLSNTNGLKRVALIYPQIYSVQHITITFIIGYAKFSVWMWLFFSSASLLSVDWKEGRESVSAEPPYKRRNWPRSRSFPMLNDEPHISPTRILKEKFFTPASALTSDYFGIPICMQME